MGRYVFFNESKTSLTVNSWHQFKWVKLYDIKFDGDFISMLPQIKDIGLLGQLGILSTSTIKVVSILDGPFMYEDEYLLENNKTFCEGTSLLCRKPIKNNISTIWKNTCCYGYSVDLLFELKDVLRFKIDLHLVEDEKYGGFTNATVYNGMVGDVYSRKADIAIAGLTISNSRMKYIDFTMPFMRVDIGIVTKKWHQKIDYMNLNFIENLGKNVVYAIGLLFVSAVFVIYSLDNITLTQRSKFDRKYRLRKNKKWYTLQDCYSYSSGLLFQREVGAVSPSTKGGRAAALFFAFAMVAVTTMYTASLTADRVIKTDQQDFKGIRDSRVRCRYN